MNWLKKLFRPERDDTTKSPQNLLLLQVKEHILLSGVPSVTDITLESRNLMQRLVALDGHVVIEAHIVEITEDTAHAPQVKSHQVHAHIITHIRSNSIPERKDTLTACMMGMGRSLEEALTETSDSWFRMVAAPILSVLAAQTVNEARHFEGHEEWGIPGGHGFVGPIEVRSFSKEINLDELFDQAQVAGLFTYDNYPKDGRLHIVKATLMLSNERWERHIEIDGHKQKHVEADWNRLPRYQGMAILTSYAIFWFEMSEQGDSDFDDTKQVQEDDALFLEAIDLMAEGKELSDEALESLLIERGYQAEDAFWLVRFIPEAYSQAWFEPRGLIFSDEFTHSKMSYQITKKLSSQPIWENVFRIAKQELEIGVDKDRLISLTIRSSSYAAVQKAMNQGLSFEGAYIQRVFMDYR